MGIQVERTNGAIRVNPDIVREAMTKAGESILRMEKQLRQQGTHVDGLKGAGDCVPDFSRGHVICDDPVVPHPALTAEQLRAAEEWLARVRKMVNHQLFFPSVQIVDEADSVQPDHVVEGTP